MKECVDHEDSDDDDGDAMMMMFMTLKWRITTMLLRKAERADI